MYASLLIASQTNRWIYSEFIYGGIAVVKAVARNRPQFSPQRGENS